MEKLPGDYIAGFVDGEGCFSLSFKRTIRHKRKNKPLYFSWDVSFAIVLREDDRNIIEQIKEALDCGRISFDKNGKVRFEVNSIIDLSEKIVPFFEQYQLRAKKQKDFELWKECVSIIKRTQRIKVNRQKGDCAFLKTKWNSDDLKRLIEIHNAMKPYKSIQAEWKWINEAIQMAS